MKVKANYHTHTTRCGHAYGEDEQYVLAAIEAGFNILGFSDHMPYDTLDFPGERVPNDLAQDYINSVLQLKEKYKDKIEILLGYELEYYPGNEEYLNKIRKQCDFLIVGQHFKNIDGYAYDFYTSDEDVIVYANQIKECCEKGYANIIAHPDYFMLGRRNWSNACLEAANIIGKAAQDNNVVIEINLNGLRYGKLPYEDGDKYPYPYYEMYKELSKYDVKFIYGYDAHRPITLLEDWRIDEVNKIIEDLNLNIVDRI